MAANVVPQRTAAMDYPPGLRTAGLLRVIVTRVEKKDRSGWCDGEESADLCRR